MDDDKRDDGRGGGSDDVTSVLARVLEGRLRDAFAKFCADIPQILRSIPKAAKNADGSDDGPEFVRALLEWIAGAPGRSEQACRYLLMWYAKSIADKGAHKLPDGPAVVELIRARLGRAELADVDLALQANWDALRYGGSLKTLASRQRKAFNASLSPEQKRRFARYLVLLPPLALAAAAPPAAAAAGAPGPGAVAPAAASPAGAWIAGAVIAVALPIVVGLAWSAVRGRAARRAPPAHEHSEPPPPAERAALLATATAPPATVVSTITAEPLTPPADPRGGAGHRATRFAWTRQVSGVSARLTGVAWSGSRAVIVGHEGALLSSGDGVRWTASVDEARSHAYEDVAYGGGLFVAVGTNRSGSDLGRLIATSADGVTWKTSSWRELTIISRVAYAGGAFVGIGSGSTVVRSVDGETWQPVALATDEYLATVEAIDGELWILGQRGSVFRSKDGLTWTQARHDVALEYGGATAGDGVYLIASHRGVEGRDGSQVWRSTDGTRWARRELDGAAGLEAAAAGSGQLVVAGDGIFSSADGLTWTTELPAATAHGLHAATWTGSMMIAVGDQGVVLTGEPAR